jgi:hypothetical protein
MQALRGRGNIYPTHSCFTSALYGGEWSASRPGTALPPGKGPQVPTGLETGCASELIWSRRLEEKSFVSAGDQTPVVQSVIRHYTDANLRGQFLSANFQIQWLTLLLRIRDASGSNLGDRLS